MPSKFCGIYQPLSDCVMHKYRHSAQRSAVKIFIAISIFSFFVAKFRCLIDEAVFLAFGYKMHAEKICISNDD